MTTETVLKVSSEGAYNRFRSDEPSCEESLDFLGINSRTFLRNRHDEKARKRRLTQLRDRIVKRRTLYAAKRYDGWASPELRVGSARSSTPRRLACRLHQPSMDSLTYFFAFLIDSPSNSSLKDLFNTRSRIASAIVGSPITSCHFSTGSWLVINKRVGH